MDVKELRDKLATLLGETRAIIDKAEKEDRDLTKEEKASWDEKMTKAKELEARIKRQEQSFEPPPVPGTAAGAPNILKIPRGDNEARALAHFIRTGDTGGVREITEQDDEGKGPSIQVPTGLQMRARESRSAVDSTMNITTAADGGAAVPTGFAGAIALRRNEIRLAEKLGVRLVPGKGTTVNYPYENADPTVFAATAEQADNGSTYNYERDVAPVMANKAFTLAKKTKKLWLTEELLDDEDINLMAAVSDTIGRAIGMTHNSALLAEIASYGSTIKTYASATAIAAGEVEDIVYGDTIGYYFDDGGSIAWVMRPSTYGNIKSITGSARMYGGNPPDSPAGGMPKILEGFPVHWSNYAAATAASAKDVYFGNWYFVGLREEPALRLVRDPFSVDGIVVLKYSFRIAYGVLIAGAVGFGVHPSA